MMETIKDFKQETLHVHFNAFNSDHKNLLLHASTHGFNIKEPLMDLIYLERGTQNTA